jgi:hypothetical protein
LSISLPQDKRIWIGGACVAVALLALVLVWVAASGGEGRSPADFFGGRTRGRSSERQSPPPIDHARWQIRVLRAGKPGHLSRQAKTRLEAQRSKLRASIKEAYDAIFLDPTQLARFFTPTAWRAFQNTNATLPWGASEVRLLWRRALIGIQASTSRRASAQVSVVARGLRDGREFKLSHRAALWLERGPKGWKIAAFDVTRRPLKLGKPKS